MKTRSAVAFSALKQQHAKVLKALGVARNATKKAKIEARKLSKMIDKFPNAERGLYAEALKRYIELIETKFGFL